MIVVIIAGGAGTRLWPLSTRDYPKHLLRVNGDRQSLLQNTFTRALQVSGDQEKVYVVSEKGHMDYVREQLPNLPENQFVIEPARRGTASCLAAALVRIAQNNHSSDEPIAFIPADHHIHDLAGFVQSFHFAATVSRREKSIVLVGVEPTYPATGFGYIQKGLSLSEEPFSYKVASFKEKPTRRIANHYISSGQYLWNCSYHIGTISMFESMLQESAPDIYKNYQLLKKAGDENYTKTYLAFKNISIEYAMTEKTQKLIVVPASFDWIDLGSFADMHSVVDTDERGNYRSGNVEAEEVDNTFVQNMEDKPVAVIGLDNVVVVNSPNGVLVVRKDMSQRVGDIGKRVKYPTK